MVDKRAYPGDADDDELDALLHPPRRRLTFESVVRDVIRELTLDDLLKSALEPLRRVVREEVEKLNFHSSHSSLRTYLDQPESSLGRDLQLRFIGKIKKPSYSDSPIEAEGRKPVRVVLVDAISGKAVNCDPLSSIKVEIVPLKGNFNSDGKDNWTEGEFLEGIAGEREGKRPLLTGDLVITLKNGEGDIHNISFTDNSKWSRTGMFRIGAKVSSGACGRKTIKEALSEPFTVKDHRGESYEKHYPPHASDKVWRLEAISKNGQRHKRLADHNIHTVEHFLQFYAKDSISLRHIIGNRAPVSNRTWDKIIEHATTCVVDGTKLYQYSAIGIQLFLNSIYRVVGVTFDGQIYLSPENLTPYQKDMVEKLKQKAYEHPENLFLLEDTAAVVISNLLMNQQPEHSISPTLDTHSWTPHSFQHDVFDQLIGSSTGQSSNQMQESNFTHRDSFRVPDAIGNYNGNNWFPSSSHGMISPTEHSTPEGIPQAYMSNWSINNTTWSHGNDIFYLSNIAEGSVSPCFPGFDFQMATGRPSIGWLKIWAAVKWGISFRKNVAAKRKPAPLPLLLKA